MSRKNYNIEEGPAEGIPLESTRRCEAFKSLIVKCQGVKPNNWPGAPLARFSRKRFGSHRQVSMSCKRVRNSIAHNRRMPGHDSWVDMPSVPDELSELIKGMVANANEGSTSPVILLVYHDQKWELRMNGKAIRCLACLTPHALISKGRHRPWGNFGWCDTSRVYAYSTETLGISLQAWDAKKGPQYYEEFLDALLRERYPIREDFGVLLTRLSGTSNAILVGLRYAKDAVPSCIEDAASLPALPSTELKNSIERRATKTFGNTWVFAEGDETKEKALETARAVDALRVPVPKTAQNNLETQKESIERMADWHPVDDVPIEPVINGVRDFIRRSRNLQLPIGIVPARSRACILVSRRDGGFVRATRLLAASQVDPESDRGLRTRLAVGGNNTSSHPAAQAIYDAEQYIVLAYEAVKKLQLETLNRGYMVGAHGVVRPEREGGKPRSFDILHEFAGFGQRMVRPSLESVKEAMPQTQTLREGVSSGTLACIAKAIAYVRHHFGEAFVASPDGTKSTDYINLELMRTVGLTCLEETLDECFPAWADNTEFREFCKDAIECFALPMASIPADLFVRKPLPEVKMTQEDFAFSLPNPFEDKTEEEKVTPPRHIWPIWANENRIFTMKETSLIIGGTGSGKSVGTVLELLREKGKYLIIQPRRVAVKNLYSQVKEIEEMNGNSTDQQLGYAIFGEKVNGRVMITTPGSHYPYLNSRKTFVVIDEAHEDNTLYDTVVTRARSLGCNMAYITATPPKALRSLPTIKLDRYDGLTRHIHEESFDNRNAMIERTLQYAGDRGGRALIVIPSIPELEKLCKKYGGVALHGAMDSAQQERAMKDDSKDPFFATLIAESSITLPNVVAVGFEAYSWKEVFDPVNRIYQLAKFAASPETRDQVKGRAARIKAHDDTNVIEGLMCTFETGFPEENTSSLCTEREGFAELSEREKYSYRGDINPLYLAASLHDRPIEQRRSKIGGSAGIRALCVGIRQDGPWGDLSRAKACIAEAALRLEGYPGAAARYLAALGPKEKITDQKRRDLLSFYERALDMDHTLYDVPDINHEKIREFLLRIKKLTDDLGLDIEMLSDEIPSDISDLLVECFPGEAFQVRNGEASWITRPSFKWECDLLDGEYLGRLSVRQKRLELKSRPCTSRPSEDRVKTVYYVRGDNRAPIKVLSSGRNMAQMLPSLINERRARLDRDATADAQIKHLFDERERFQSLVLESGVRRSRGSPQSTILSFPTLNILSAYSVTLGGLKTTLRVLKEKPESLIACGLPSYISQKLLQLEESELEEPKIGRVHGDDRCTVSRLESVAYLTQLTLPVINRCEISPKSRLAVFKKNSRTFPLATFCAHVIDPHGAYHVNDTRRFVRMNGIDGIHPTQGIAPSWILVGIQSYSKDVGYTSLNKRVRRLHPVFSQTPDIAYCATVQQETDALRVAKEIQGLYNSSGDSCGFTHAISLALATYPMNSRPPKYLSEEEALRRYKRGFLSNPKGYDQPDSQSYALPEESHLEVYDEIESNHQLH